LTYYGRVLRMSIHRACAIAPLLAICVAPACATEIPAQGAAIFQVQNYVHTVADMDRSIAFYKDAMGLAINAPPFGAAPTDRLSLRENLNVTTNTPGATFRPTYFRIPGHPDWGLELLQFGNIARTPVQPRMQDPGASILMLQVRDLDAMLSKLKAGGATVVSSGGSPVNMPGKVRSILLKDLDGMYIELDQLLNQSKEAAPAHAPKGNILAAKVAISVADSNQTVHFYRDLLGFTVDRPHAASKLLADLFNTPGAEILITTAKLPGTTVELHFLEFKNLERQPIHPHMQDPGAPQFTIYFKDPEAANEVFHAEGVPFLGTTTVWDPNGIIILVRAAVPFY